MNSESKSVLVSHESCVSNWYPAEFQAASFAVGLTASLMKISRIENSHQK